MVGENIHILRKANRMSCQDLSDKLNGKGLEIGVAAISKIEHGQRTVIDIELKAFAEIFGVKVSTLFDKWEYEEVKKWQS